MTHTTDPRRRAWAEIDLSALRHNIRVLRERYGASGTRIMAILKADSYGHGTGIVAPACWAEGILDYGVATTDEAIALRALLPDAWIYVLPPVTPAEADAIVEHDIIALVSDLGLARAFSEAAQRQDKTAEIQIDVDTGMGRSGFAFENVAMSFDMVASLPNIRISGVGTHFARADENAEDALAQQIAFLRILHFDTLHSLGHRIDGLDIHLYNSPGVLLFGEHSATSTIVRPGLLLYGIEPAPGMLSEASLSLEPVLSLKARVVLCRDLRAGTTVSYGKTYTVPGGGGRYATVAIGYGDGLSRPLSNVGAVGLRGKAAAICGRVCMDQLVVDVSGIDGVEVGDVATVVGRDGGFSQTAGDIASITDQTPHEITTELLPRIPRVGID